MVFVEGWQGAVGVQTMICLHTNLGSIIPQVAVSLLIHHHYH
jgi:hypothetical protein